jgi:hypothetical protein
MVSVAALVFKAIGLRSSKRSILMLVATWILSLFWLGINYFWRFASIEVLLTIPIILLCYAVVALIAYIYWGVRDIHENDSSYANLLVGSIVAFTLLYFNVALLQFLTSALQY